MRRELTIFGATGRTGSLLVTQALAQGHRVTAVAREPASLGPLAHARLRLVRGDVFDPAAVTPAVEGADAVLSALGPHRGAGDLTVCSRATSSILRAMHESGVRRIVTISGAPVPRNDPGDNTLMRAVLKPLLHKAYGGVYADLALMEALLSASAAEWTVFRPPLLTRGSPSGGRYRTTIGRNAGGLRVSRADLAYAMLHALDDPATVRTTVGIAA